MTHIKRARTVAPLAVVAGVVVMFAVGAGATTGGSTSYTPGTPVLATIANGASAAPWNLFQGDSGSPTYSSQAPGTVLPTFTPGGATTPSGEPNLSVYPGATSGTDGNSPYPSGTVGTPGPLSGYCGTGTNGASATGAPASQPAGTSLPFAPAYFPHVVRNADGSLTGYFDYRPKDADEAIVAAKSADDGVDWTYQGEALQQNPGYCPNADVNDDGEGHPNVVTIGGTSRLYTLERAAGDNIGVGLLVHTLNPTSADPLSGLQSTEETGVDPDDFAAGAVKVLQTGAPTTATISLAYPVGNGLEQLVPGEFVDLTATPTPTAATVIKCAGVAAQSLTGCSTPSAAGIDVSDGDLIEQVIATILSGLAASSPATGCTLPCTVPKGPNTTTGDGGLKGFNIAGTNPNNLTLATLNADAPNRAYIDGVAVYCTQANALPTSKIENCTTGPKGSPLSVSAGDPLTSDPIVPATAQQTTGLVAPDGIVGVLPGYPGAPAGSTIVLYTEKLLNYFIVGYTGGKTTFSAGMSIPFTSFPNTSSASFGSAPYTVAIGDATPSPNTIIMETCSGLSVNTLTGCNGGPIGDTISKNSYIGAPGAATVSASTLAEIGEGSATNSQKLLKNNEDLTVLRVAYTTNGVDFSSTGLANDGVISGASNGASNYTDINNPASTTSPANLNMYGSPGTAVATEMRFVGSGGTILVNPDGSYGLFLSGAWAADGDSDAFNQMWYSSSTDGENWSIPVSLLSTDYTFGASQAQQGTTNSLGINAYYSGRAYGPSVVQNPDGTLTMVFAGYRLPSPAGTVGGKYGTGANQYTIGPDDPLLYRQILTSTLSSATSPGVTTATGVASSAPTTKFGTQVTYTATVNVPAPGTGLPTGTVAFSDNGTPIPGCTAVVLADAAPDTATCTVYPTGGQHTIKASYSGDSNYAGSSGSTNETVTYTSTINGKRNGPLAIGPGEAVEVGPGATVSGPVSIKPGGALDVEGGTISGPVTVNGATAFRACGATLTGPVDVEQTTGPVVIGDGTAVCAADTLGGPATVSGSKGGVWIVGATVGGPLAVSQNAGGVTVKDNKLGGPASIQNNSGGTTVTGNTVAGPLTVAGNTGTVIDKPNTVKGGEKLQ